MAFQQSFNPKAQKLKKIKINKQGTSKNKIKVALCILTVLSTLTFWFETLNTYYDLNTWRQYLSLFQSLLPIGFKQALAL
jgi:hypothetical protein